MLARALEGCFGLSKGKVEAFTIFPPTSEEDTGECFQVSLEVRRNGHLKTVYRSATKSENMDLFEALNREREKGIVAGKGEEGVYFNPEMAEDLT